MDGAIKVLAVGTREQAWLFPDDPFLNHGLRILRAASLEDARAIFDTQLPQLAFLPLRLDGASTLADVKDWLTRVPETTIVVVANNDEINDAAEAMRNGAFDCLFTPFSRVRLSKTVESALRQCRPPAGARSGSVAVASPPKAPTPATLSATVAPPPGPSTMTEPPVAPLGVVSRDTDMDAICLIGGSPSMSAVLDKVEAVARSDATVFIQGEHGAGKEALARDIHARSARRQASFVPVDCAALRTETIERDLLGLAGQPGTPGAEPLLHLARDGTLYLDEICNLSPPVQAQFLRVLQRCAASDPGQPHRTAIRVICSTARDPFVEMEEGRLRVDLFYRLHVATLTMPPLRTRDRDVLEIAQARLKHLSAREGRGFAGFSPEAQGILLRHKWPGNVRQLLNVIWNVVLNHDAATVEAHMLPEELSADTRGFADQAGQAGSHVPIHGRTLAEIERDVIEAVIHTHGGSIPRAARALDVSPSTIYRKREAWLREDRDKG
ncbi:sigma 54-interacting transcriptional regulator [Aliiroseovarius sp.]|uniref:sigma-54-dependent transcriptional regulator n=1 Tax=Aliiroseovarius sp. TaxID=1872442 RepID=UPI002635224E|nr:sigma 54-interacting transcriptional regulator [Aliiroseovarius sp.]